MGRTAGYMVQHVHDPVARAAVLSEVRQRAGRTQRIHSRRMILADLPPLPEDVDDWPMHDEF